jgi:hypothetical protein
MAGAAGIMLTEYGQGIVDEGKERECDANAMEEC